MNPKILGYTALLGGFAAWRLYRRFRTQTGPQPYRPARLVARAFLLFVVCGYIAWFASRNGMHSVWLVGSLVGGLTLGGIALRLTRFDFASEPRHYIPNLYLGAGIFLLLAGRIVYNFGTFYVAMRSGLNVTPPMRSSATTAVVLIICAFYASYDSLLVLKFNAATSNDRT